MTSTSIMATQLRTIFVTGANQGLGMHTVHQLAQKKNILVFMGSRKISNAEAAVAKFAADIHPSSTVVPVQLDLTDDNSILSAATTVKETLRQKCVVGLDVIVNNAGAADGFRQTYAVNVIGTAALTTALRPMMNNGGAIVNISSRLGSLTWHTERPVPPSLQYHPAYSSSKAALNQLTLVWAIEEEQKGSGIRVVAVCPGFNATSLNGYMGTASPAEGCKIIVETVLATEGKSGAFFNKHGPIDW
ncbi:Short-chain dehydrogenase/reductase family protein [Mycena kentingensis (nom. inval.)]|nr:Short-chain dehydrogenase/reductase family protein [Mycena kentingensis (nom. inval.)]